MDHSRSSLRVCSRRLIARMNGSDARWRSVPLVANVPTSAASGAITGASLDVKRNEPRGLFL